MKLSKSLLSAMLVAVASGTIISCEKAVPEEGKKPPIQNTKGGASTPEGTLPEGCPACGMG